VSDSTALVVRTLPSDRDAAAERFLARVARLTAAEWGRLDAIGERLGAGDPIARWRRADRWAALAGVRGRSLPRLGATLAVLGFGAELVSDLLGGRAGRRLPATFPEPSPHAAPEARRAHAQLRTLLDAAAAQPGDATTALPWLALALFALRLRDALAPEAFARLYAPVEPVIPAASVDR
jgi:hypothetical protein